MRWEPITKSVIVNFHDCVKAFRDLQEIMCPLRPVKQTECEAAFDEVIGGVCIAAGVTEQRIAFLENGDTLDSNRKEQLTRWFQHEM